MFRSVLRNETLLALLFSLCLPVCYFANPTPASAQFKTWVMTKLPDTPEGLGIDPQGNLYAALFHTGEVVKLKDDGSYEHIAWVPSQQDSGTGTMRGLE